MWLCAALCVPGPSAGQVSLKLHLHPVVAGLHARGPATEHTKVAPEIGPHTALWTLSLQVDTYSTGHEIYQQELLLVSATCKILGPTFIYEMKMIALFKVQQLYTVMSFNA